MYKIKRFSQLFEKSFGGNPDKYPKGHPVREALSKHIVIPSVKSNGKLGDMNHIPDHSTVQDQYDKLTAIENDAVDKGDANTAGLAIVRKREIKSGYLKSNLKNNDKL